MYTHTVLLRQWHFTVHTVQYNEMADEEDKESVSISHRPYHMTGASLANLQRNVHVLPMPANGSPRALSA